MKLQHELMRPRKAAQEAAIVSNTVWLQRETKATSTAAEVAGQSKAWDSLKQD